MYYLQITLNFLQILILIHWIQLPFINYYAFIKFNNGYGNNTVGVGDIAYYCLALFINYYFSNILKFNPYSP